MKIFNSIQFSSARSGPICQNCMHFQNDPALVEEMYHGLSIMSSGWASVRDRDGFCHYNQLYLSAWDSCPHFASRAAELNQAELGKAIVSGS